MLTLRLCQQSISINKSDNHFSSFSPFFIKIYLLFQANYKIKLTQLLNFIILEQLTQKMQLHFLTNAHEKEKPNIFFGSNNIPFFVHI